MSDRMLKINEQLRSELSELLSRGRIMDDALITITKVKCSPNLQAATVLISVLPENMSGTALKILRTHSSEFCSALHKKLKIKFIPRFNWKIDSQERYALEIDQAIQKMKNNEYDSE